MTSLFDFIELVGDEIQSLLEVCPDYITTIFSSCVVISILLAVRRAIW